MNLARHARSLAARTGELPEALLRELAMERVAGALCGREGAQGFVLRGSLWLRARGYRDAAAPRDLDLLCAPGQGLRDAARAMDAALAGAATVLAERVLYGDTDDPGLRRTVAFALEKHCMIELDVDLAQGYATLEPVALAWPGRIDGRVVSARGSHPAVVLAEQVHALLEKGPSRAPRAFATLCALEERERVGQPALAAALGAALRRWGTSPARVRASVQCEAWPEALRGLRARVLEALA